MDKPGYIDGKHFTEYVNTVVDLKRANKLVEAEHLLLKLVYATEEQAHFDGLGVAPWYYHQLAIIYRKQEEHSKEVAILERFASQFHGPGVMPAKLLSRLEKIRQA